MKTKNLFRAFTVACVAASFAACSNTPKAASGEDLSPLMGMYEGTLPCADCSGIDTYLTLNADSTVALTQSYQTDDPNAETQYGKWSYQDSLFTVTTEVKGEVASIDTAYYKVTGNNELCQVNKEKEVNKLYMLKKTEPMVADNFLGTYNQGDANGGAYQQTLIITKGEDGKVNVEIKQTSGKGKGCEFKGVGKVVNDQILIDLHEVNKDMHSTMVIRMMKDQQGLTVLTANFDNRYDLNFFCGGGGSLSGDYTKAAAK